MSNLLYDALMLGRNKKVENEEFLVATGKKDAASFAVTEESVTISNVISDGEFSVHLYQTVPGYMEIEVFCRDNFIIFDKKIITSEEFIDNRYEIKLMIISDRLHNGRNFTSVFFRTSGQNVEVPVVIDNKVRVRLSREHPGSRNIELMQKYLQFGMDRLPGWQWIQESRELLNDITGDDETSLFLMLYKAQLQMTSGDSAHARNYIEYVGTQIPKLEKKNYDLYCYFIYLASLYEEIDGVINFAAESEPAQEPRQAAPSGRRARAIPPGVNVMDMTALQKVHWVYLHYPSWWILWLLFYMDPDDRADPAGMLGEIRERYYKARFTSPVMYLQALKILQNDPALMQEIGEFELQVLYFAVRYEYLADRLAQQAADILLRMPALYYEAGEYNLAVRILHYAYDRFQSAAVRRALCRVLISSDCRDPFWHFCFARAIEKEAPDAQLYEYFIHTLDQSSMEPVPEQVMEYFLEHTELLYEYKPYMYANLISNRYLYPDLYRTHLESIIKYAASQMMMGQNDDILAVIYRELLENEMLTPEMKNNLFDVICSREVFCGNERMRSVLVFHRELPVYQESILRNGRAYIRIYSADALILFKDATGNLYHHIDYKINQLVETRKYIDLCLKDVPVNRYMLMGDTLPLLRAYKSPTEILQYFTSHRIYGEFRRDYEQELLKNTVSYYVKNSRDEAVYDELLKFREYDLPPETRGLLIRIMLKRDLVEDAYLEVKEYGTAGLDNGTMAELAHAYIEKYGGIEDDLLTALCEAGYQAGGFDEAVFDYLYHFYNGRMDLMVDLYRACHIYGRPPVVIEERILNKSMLTGEHPDIVSVIFQRYYEQGRNRELIRKYMEYRSSVFLYEIMKGTAEGAAPSDLGFFACMEKDMMQGKSFSDESMIAYLLYSTGVEDPSERQIRSYESCLKDLVRRGKMLEEFKYFARYFELPSTLANNIIISAFSEDPEKKPFIAFEITGPGNPVSGAQEMEEIFRHCYVKYFTLFYGEKVVFSMDGESSREVRYDELKIQHDGSRYAFLDDMIRYRQQNNREAFMQAAGELYIREKMIEILL